VSGAPQSPAAALSDAARRVQAALEGAGFTNRVMQLAVPVRTAAAAAEAVGCRVEQIVKSLVFRRRSGAALLVVASGSNRVDLGRLAVATGEDVTLGDPVFVRESTGFAIGGIPPLGHSTALETLIDRDLLKLDALWAAAGHPNALFPLTPDELVRMTRGRVIEVA
jgi:prolyl-tRNA editing enzyme YbaK/EbsC (Cys-tRNA(Pro) deacylase)